MKNKVKLAFKELEAEMLVISKEQSVEFKGGDDSTGSTGGGLGSGWGDCVIESISFATGSDYNAVLDAYGLYMEARSGGSASGWELQAVSSGIQFADLSGFASAMGLTNAGDSPNGPIGQSVSGDQCMAILNNGDGTGHAVVLTGNANSTEYDYYDPQNGTTGTIRKLDSRIAGTWGY